VTVAFLDLSRQVAADRDELDEAIRGVLDSGRFILGERVERFEEEFARYCGASEAVGVASGTAAISLALRGLGIGDGDEVVVPANVCVPTVAGIQDAGAVPVLVDVERETGTLDPAELESAVTSRTRAVVAVHLYGQCASMDPIVAFARARGLRVVEDAAHAHGAELGGRRAGTLGDASAFSFYPTKNLGALGDAGAVVTDDAAVAERVRMLRSYGERTRYESVAEGTNSRMDELQAAVLSVKLRHLDERNERRRTLAELYLSALADLELELPIEAPGRRHVYHLFVVRTSDRDGLRARLAAAGVETGVHYPRPVHAHPAYARLARPGALSRSERQCAEVLSLPLHAELRDDEADEVAVALRRALETATARA
jgi:dTDP-4-amino-4,6-dideoxygalactose transaminase